MTLCIDAVRKKQVSIVIIWDFIIMQAVTRAISLSHCYEFVVMF